MTIDIGAHHEEVDLGTRDLVLSPSILNWPHLTAQVCGPHSAAINYPVRGMEARDARDPDALARLYGETRARLLADLQL